MLISAGPTMQIMIYPLKFSICFIDPLCCAVSYLCTCMRHGWTFHMWESSYGHVRGMIFLNGSRSYCSSLIASSLWGTGRVPLSSWESISSSNWCTLSSLLVHPSADVSALPRRLCTHYALTICLWEWGADGMWSPACQEGGGEGNGSREREHAPSMSDPCNLLLLALSTLMSVFGWNCYVSGPWFE